MKIAIIVGGRFHAFNLAEQLNKFKVLDQLITSYPKFYIKKNYEIDLKVVKSIFIKEIISRSIGKSELLNKYFKIDNFIIDYFDKSAARLLNSDNLDVLVGWSSFSLNSFLKIKNSKCIKVLERGSTHIEFQKNILKEEYELLGIKPRLPSNEIIDKEIQEYELSDYICVPSNFAKQSFIDKGFDEKKIIKIPYGVNLKNFYKIKNKLDKEKFIIIYVGTSSVRKGVYYLLKAFTELNLNNSELLIIGNIEKEIIPTIKKFKNNNIKFIESQKQGNLNEFYNKADVFITCSIEEGLSMVQAQAMACGLPVICTTNTGGTEIIDDGKSGFILPIRNIDELKKKIIYFYENREICDFMGNNAHKKALNFLSWKNYGREIIEFYNRIVSSK